MAAITTGVIGAVGAAGSAYSSYRGARAQENAQRDAQSMAQQGALNNFGFSNGLGSGSFDVNTGQLTTQLGDRLQGQQGLFDTFGQLFGSQVGQDFTSGLNNTLGLQSLVAGANPQANQGLFAALQQGLGGGLGIAQQGLSQAASGIAPGLRNQVLGLAGQQFADIGNGQQAADNQLALLRQQAQPFEERAFSSLQDSLFSTGRLGSTGGALQTEAFARGLGQADLSRQLAASQEGRAYQQNAANLGQGLAQTGFNEASLSGSLLNNAFSNFGNLAQLSGNLEQSRFGQTQSSQQNAFSQLGQLFQNQMGASAFGQSSQGQALQNALAAFGAGNAVEGIPLDFLNAAAQSEQARSSSYLGGAGVTGGLNFGQGSDAIGSAFSGLAGAAQNGGLSSFLQQFGRSGPAPGVTSGNANAGAVLASMFPGT